MYESNGALKRFYEVLDVTSDNDFVKAVESHVDFKQNLASTTRQIETLRASRKFEKFQLAAVRRLEEKIKSREEKISKLRILAPTHKKFASLEDKVKRLSRRIREIRAFQLQLYQQEFVKRRLQNEPDPYQIDWWNISKDDEKNLETQIADLKLKKAENISLQTNLQKLLDEAKSLIREKVKRQYKRLAFQYHPDRYQGDTQSTGYIEAVKTFQDLSQAFQVLSDDGKRERYNTAPSHEVYLSFYPEDLNLEEAVVSSNKVSRHQRQQQAQRQLMIEYALPDKCPRPILTPRKRGKAWILNVDWSARTIYTQTVTHFACEVKVDDGPFELVYGGEKSVFDYIARLPGFYTFRARACNALGEGAPSEEVCLLIKDGEVLDPYDAEARARTSSKSTISKLSNLRKRRAKRKKLLRLGEETPSNDKKQSKDSPQLRQLHKLIYSPHCTVEQLQKFLESNPLDLLSKFTSSSSRGKGGENALIAAIRAERADLAHVLLQRKYVEHYNVNDPDSSFGRSPLIWAIVMHASEVAFALLQLKKVVIDVNKADNDGCSPLYWAVALRCSYALINALVKRGADPNQPLMDDAGRPTFLLHEFILLNDFDASKQLISQFKAQPDPLNTMEELYRLEITACIDEIELVGHSFDRTSLNLSREISSNSSDAGTELVNDESVDDEDDAGDAEEGEEDEEDEEDDLPDPPILSALQQRSSSGFDIFTALADQWLSSAGADSKLRDLRLSIMAHFAVYTNNLDALRWLVNIKHFSVDAIDASGRSMLHTALALGSENLILAFLMQDCNCNDQIVDKNGFNPLQLSNLVAEQQREQEAQNAKASSSTSTSTSSSDQIWGAIDENVSESVRAALLRSDACESDPSSPVEESSHLLSLPMEILTIIVGSLNAKELCKFQRTCKDGLAVGRSDLVWRNLVIQVFGGQIRGHIKSYSISWMHSFRQKIKGVAHCNYCKSISDVKLCGCANVHYCSPRCREADFIWHSRHCEKLQKDIRWAKLLFRKQLD